MTEIMTMSETKEIFNRDLLQNKNAYTIDILERNFKNLNKRTLLYTQVLTADFCAKYIYVDDDIDSCSEDSYTFDEGYILECQPHIGETELSDAIEKFWRNQ